MLRRPRLKTYLSVFPISDSKWGLRGGSNELCRVELKSETALRTFSALLPLLTGRYETSDILDQLESQGLPRGAVEALLQRLHTFKCLEEADDHGLTEEQSTTYRSQIEFFSHFTDQGGASLQATLAQRHVAIVGSGALASSIGHQLKTAGVDAISFVDVDAEEDDLPRSLSAEALWPSDRADELPDAFVVAQDRLDPELLEAMDTFSKTHDVSWMLVRALSTQEGWVGPLFIPRETASYLSLEARLRGNIPFFEEYSAMDRHLRGHGKAGPPSGSLKATNDVLGGIAVTELVKFLTGYEVPHLAGRFLTIDLTNWETEVHDVLRVPRLDDASAFDPKPFPWKEALYGESGTHDRRS